MINTLINQRYQIKTELGSGGMGVVYEAYDLLLEREVAVKALHRDVLDPDNRLRLLHEARAVARLNHPNIVSVYDAGEVDGVPYIVMELVHGKNLRAMGDLSLVQLATIGRQMCEALNYAHSQGVIHRDIKPENILVEQIDDHLTAKLNDFGLALSTHTGRMTQAGALMGTPFYMAPELIQGGTASSQSDLYALGAVFYECTVGRPPFEGDNLIAVLSQHINAPVVPASTFKPDFPPAMDRLLLQMLDKNPENRLTLKRVLTVLDEVENKSVSAETPLTLSPLDRMVRGRLVAREHELDQAISAWQQAMTGDSGVLLISGEPGIGKTRFIREMMTQAQFFGTMVLLSECFSEGSPPYTPITQMIKAVPIPTGMPSYALACLISLAPGLAALYPDIPLNTPLDPDAELQRLSDSLVEWCRLLCQTGPVMLILDDAHWADNGTLVLLRNLARRASRMKLRFMLVLTYREVELDEQRALNDVLYSLNKEHLATRIKLTRLDRSQTEGMLATLFDEEITPELLDAVYRETEGNPFFIEEVCKALVEEGQIYRDGKGWSRLAIEQMEIPQSVRVAIQSRVMRLPEPVQETLRLAAILGREFEFSVLQAVSDQDEESLIAAIEQTESAQLIREKQVSSRSLIPSTPTFLFTHALIHATLYESLSGLRRQRLHRQVAAALENLYPDNQAALAHHYAQAGMPDQARNCYLLAGEKALSTFAHQDAEKYFRLALDLAGPPIERARELFGLGTALYGESRPAEAMDVWKQSIPIFQKHKEMDRLANTYASLTAAARLMDDIQGSLEIAEEGLGAIADAPPSIGVAALYRQAGTTYSFRGISERARGLWQQALKISEEIGCIEEQSLTLIRMGFDLAYDASGSKVEEGTQMINRAYELAEAGGILKAAELAQSYLGEISRDFKGDLQAAIDHTTLALQLSHQSGDVNSELFNLGMLSSIHTYLGNLTELETLVERGYYLQQLVETSGPGMYVFRLSQAVLSYLRGDWDRTRIILQEGFDEARRNKNTGYANIMANFLSGLLMDEGRWHEVELTLEQSFQQEEYQMNASDFSQLAIVYSNTGRLEAARQMLDNAKKVEEGYQLSANRISIMHAEAELAAAEQRSEAAWDCFEELTGMLSRAGLRFQEFRLLCRWIALRLELGKEKDILEARRLLERLISLCEGMGAAELARKAKEQLEKL